MRRRQETAGADRDHRDTTDDGITYDHVSARFDRALGAVTITVRGPEGPAPSTVAGQGADFWPLAVTRELDDLILLLRTNEPALGTWLVTTAGDADAVLDHERLLLADVPPDALVMLDPNCRPGAIADRAAYLGRIGRIAARADVVKASVEDLAYLYPGSPPAEAAESLLAAGPTLVLVTDGPRPARAFLPGTVLTVKPTPRSPSFDIRYARLAPAVG